MSDMLRKGQEWLASQLTHHASRQVVYRRGELGVTLQATIGRSMYDQDDDEGIVTRSQVRDFLIDTYSLLDSIIGSLPRRGDTIVKIDGNHTFIFEVMPLGSDPTWRYSDPFRVKLRSVETLPCHPDDQQREDERRQGTGVSTLIRPKSTHRLVQTTCGLNQCLVGQSLKTTLEIVFA